MSEQANPKIRKIINLCFALPFSASSTLPVVISMRDDLTEDEMLDFLVEWHKRFAVVLDNIAQSNNDNKQEITCLKEQRRIFGQFVRDALKDVL